MPSRIKTLIIILFVGLCLAMLYLLWRAVRKPVASLQLGPWFTLQPAQRLPEELLLLRGLFAYVLWLGLPPVLWEFQSGQPHPNGLAHFIDFSFLAAPGVWPMLHYISLALIACYALGVALPVVMPLLLALHICIYTLNNSQGYIGHSMQLVSLIVLAQTVAFTLWPLWKRVTRLSSPLTSGDMAVAFTSQTIAASYVICGLAKLVNTKGAWLADVPNLAVQLHKTAQADYYNTLVRQAAPLQDFMFNLLVESPNLARIAFGSGLFLELAALMALFGRRWELALGLAIIAMHNVISEAMSLSFPFHIWVLFVFWVNLPFWLGWAGRRLAARSAKAPAPTLDAAEIVPGQ